MKITRGLFFGFIVGAVVGLVIYLRMQQEGREDDLKWRMLRINIADGEPSPAPPTQKRPAQPASPHPPGPDPLIEIQGIGQVYARRLQEAGVRTFADLAVATPAQLAEIIGPRARTGDLKAWIAAAKKLSY